jgi:cysteine desulfurase / selenocysteine lyase
MSTENLTPTNITAVGHRTDHGEHDHNEHDHAEHPDDHGEHDLDEHPDDHDEPDRGDHHDHDHHHHDHGEEEYCPIIGGTPIDAAAVRALFPFFQQQPGLIPFNNAATTQVPAAVIDTITSFLQRGAASPGRGALDELTTGITSRLESARVKVADFIGACAEDIVFTSGTTASLNLVALGWGLKNLKDGDEIMVCLEDHKSTVLPWLNLKGILASFGVHIKIVPIALHQMGNYELQSIEKAKTERTRLLAMSHVHHVYGLNMEVHEIRAMLGPDVLISLDAAQSVGHRPVNLEKLPVDFLSFSGHKMFALSGVGVLWVSPKLRNELQSPVVGGGMQPEEEAEGEGGGVFKLKLPSTSLATMLEAGTPNIPAILSMVPAIEFIESTGMDIIQGRIKELMKHLYLSLRALPGIEFSPGLDHCWHQSHGILSFRFSNAKTTDMAFVLAEAGILVRAGDHCVFRKEMGDDYLRVSLHVYNTEEEIERFVAVLSSTLA